MSIILQQRKNNQNHFSYESIVTMNRRDFIKYAGTVVGLAAYVGFAQAGQKPVKEQVVSLTRATELPFVPGSWTLVVLPDVQNYSESYPGLFNLQTQWIADNRKKYNITYVAQLGDVTNHNTAEEWQYANEAMGRLDGIVPYVITTGNHDYRQNGAAKDRTTLMNDYFPPSRFAKWKTFGGVMEKGHSENSYHFFQAASEDWLILGLEFAPRDKTLQWADSILAKYPKHKAIIITHVYLRGDATRFNWYEKDKEQKLNPHTFYMAGGVNDGEEIWQKLVKKRKNIFMVISGHVSSKGQGYLLSQGDSGNPVSQMVVDFQNRPVGGESWMRLLEFLPDGRTIQVRDYCPLTDKYNTDNESQFIIKIPQ